MYKLIGVDIDGTLLRSDRALTERTRRALHRVAETGAAVVLCTGRADFTTLSVEAQLSLPVHVICYNGALALPPAQSSARNPLFSHTLSQDQVAQILGVADSLHLVMNVYEFGKDFIRARVETDDQQKLAERFQGISKRIRYEFVADYSSVVASISPPKLILLSNDTDAVMAELKRSTSGINAYQESYFVDCVPASANKGLALTKLCDILGISVAESVAFGDGNNDVEFLTAAGLGFAMKNGEQRLKAVADKVTAYSNDEDGLAIEIEKLLDQVIMDVGSTSVETYAVFFPTAIAGVALNGWILFAVYRRQSSNSGS
ncbi:hypothetical protein HK100_010226, partial [Physocladia obscura]